MSLQDKCLLSGGALLVTSTIASILADTHGQEDLKAYGNLQDSRLDEADLHSNTTYQAQEELLNNAARLNIKRRESFFSWHIEKLRQNDFYQYNNVPRSLGKEKVDTEIAAIRKRYLTSQRWGSIAWFSSVGYVSLLVFATYLGHKNPLKKALPL